MFYCNFFTFLYVSMSSEDCSGGIQTQIVGVEGKHADNNRRQRRKEAKRTKLRPEMVDTTYSGERSMHCLLIRWSSPALS